MSEPNMVRVKLKKGSWEIEISCPGEKVQRVIENVLSGMERVGTSGASAILTETQPLRGSATCKGLIEALWTEKWFLTERSLANVHEELARRGFNYDRTAVSHSLTDLVRENILTRIGTMRAYRYIQKKPPDSKA